nr:MFS transporter [Lentzea sp. NBRC 105346]
MAAGLALTRISNQAAMLAGPALGGLVASWAGVGTCYLLDAVTFALVLHAAYRLPPQEVNEPSRPGLHGVLDGLRFMACTPPVRGVLLADLATTVLSMPISLFPLINAERFGGDPSTLGLFMSAIAVGGVAASFLSGTFTRLSRPGLVMLCGSATWGLALVLFGVSTNPWLGLAFLVIAGAADTVAVVSRSTVVQLLTPDALLGRVSAAEQIVGQAGPDLGNLRAGLVAGIGSGATALVSGGLMCVAAVAWIAAATPALPKTRLQA